MWHSSITKEEDANLERVQKVCLRIILKSDYISYEDALKRLDLETLSERRKHLCLEFAKSCLKHDRNKLMFPLNTSDHLMAGSMRHHEKFLVQHANTDRLANSAIPYLQRVLNEYYS